MNPTAEEISVARSEIVGDVALAFESRRVEEDAEEEMAGDEPGEEEETEDDVGGSFVFGVNEEFGELSYGESAPIPELD